MSEIVELITKLSFNKGTNLVFIIFGTLIAPFWFLFQFANNIYNNSDILHLLILSVAIGMPVCLISFTFEILSDLKIKENQSLLKDNDYIFSLIGKSCIIPGFSFYIPCAFKFFNLL